jgi:hypothetical protein
MQLMGDWDVSSMLSLNKEFVTSATWAGPVPVGRGRQW